MWITEDAGVTWARHLTEFRLDGDILFHPFISDMLLARSNYDKFSVHLSLGKTRKKEVSTIGYYSCQIRTTSLVCVLTSVFVSYCHNRFRKDVEEVERIRPVVPLGQQRQDDLPRGGQNSRHIRISTQQSAFEVYRFGKDLERDKQERSQVYLSYQDS